MNDQTLRLAPEEQRIIEYWYRASLHIECKGNGGLNEAVLDGKPLVAHDLVLVRE